MDTERDRTDKNGFYVCEVCKRHDKDFRVPAGDHIGFALMTEHLYREHPYRAEQGAV